MTQRNSIQPVKVMPTAFMDSRTSSEIYEMTVEPVIKTFTPKNIISQASLKKERFQIFVLCLIPNLMLIGICGVEAYKSYAEYETMDKTRVDVHFCMDFAYLVHNLQIERGRTSLFISSGGLAGTRKQLLEQHEKTEKVLKTRILEWPTEYSSDRLQTRENFLKSLRTSREEFLALNASAFDSMKWYTSLNNDLISVVAKTLKRVGQISFWHDLTAYYLMSLGKDLYGVERGHGSGMFPNGSFSTAEEHFYFYKNMYNAEFSFGVAHQFSDDVRDKLEKLKKLAYYEKITEYRQQLIRNKATGGPSIEAGRYWFGNMTLYINDQLKIYDDLGANIMKALETEIFALNVYTSLSFSLFLFVSIMTPLQLTKMMKLLKYILELVTSNREQVKITDDILKEMLPTRIAYELKNKIEIHPETFSCCSIYFSDICGFTSISAKCTANEVFDFLDITYTVFDKIIDCYFCYKVETIGDAYMVSAGVPEPLQNHAAEITDMAFSLLNAAREIENPSNPGQNIQIRIGLHCGPVVAGIVGRKMPRYCLFGDTVNVASRMESMGIPMKIHCSKKFGEVLSQSRSRKGYVYTLTKRPFMEIKGKGIMETCFVNDRFRSSISAGRPGSISA